MSNNTFDITPSNHNNQAYIVIWGFRPWDSGYTGTRATGAVSITIIDNSTGLSIFSANVN